MFATRRAARPTRTLRCRGPLALAAGGLCLLLAAPALCAREVSVPDADTLTRLLLRPAAPGARYRFAPPLRAAGEVDAEWLTVRNLTLLGACTWARTLSLRHARLTSFAALRRLPRLERLDLSRTGIRHLAPLAGLSALRELDLSDTPVSDVAPLSRLPRLAVLNLAGTRVTSLAPLAGRRLDRLVLGRPGLGRLPDLRGLAGVGTLVLRAAAAGLALRDLRTVRLEELVLDGTGVTGIGALAAHPTLQRLSLRHARVPLAAVRALLRRSPGLQVVLPDGRVVGRVVVWEPAAPDPRDYPCLVGTGACTTESFGRDRWPVTRFVMP